MDSAFEFTLNGRSVRVEGLSPNATLLDFLRGRGLTGAKEGCAEGDCGACSVALLGRNAEGRQAWRAINSCLVPVACLAGRQLKTVEGIGNSAQPHPAQRCLVERHGSQCGYCTPGVVMSIYEACHRPELREPWQLDDQLSGNLCRCTGYRPIRDAARDAMAETRFPEFIYPTIKPPAALEYQAATERFFRPATLDDLWRLLRHHPEAKLIAGGTELGLDLTKHFKRFPTLIALDGLPELQGIREERDHWSIGAATTLSEIEDHPRLVAEFPALLEMLRLFGSRQIRNRATLGGNLATASPIGDAAPVLLALDARLALGGRRTRDLGLASFFTGYRETALLEREVMCQVLIPRGNYDRNATRRSAFYKVSRRREMDIATVSACFVIELDKDDFIRHIRLAYGGVAATPVRAKRTEQALMGKRWLDRTIERVLPTLAAEFKPISDVRGSAEFRRGLITSLFEKFFRETTGAPDSPPAWSSHRTDEPDRGGALLPPPHESALLHVTGEAGYADDQTAGMLEVWPVCAPHAHARIVRRDAIAARAMLGVRAVLLAEDAPGVNDVGPVRPDEPLLAHDEISFHGQMVALVVGDSAEACRTAAEKVVVEYEAVPPILSIAQAIEQGSFHTTPHVIKRGDPARALSACPHHLSGEFEMGGQDHFYLETQAAWAKPGEAGTMHVVSSTQHPTEVQHAVARVLGVADNQITVQVPRVGGGFGGKETQAAAPAALAALAAQKTGQAVRVRFNRDQDMALTGKRHPFLAKFDAAFGADGALQALRVELFSDGGWSLDLSQAVCDRALLHLDNAYYIPHAEFSGRVCKTHLASNTAFRGFGGPQGMLVIEEILDRIARQLGLPPEQVREKNLYRGIGDPNTTPYGQEIEDQRTARVWQELKQSSDFTTRREALRQWNAAHPHRKRGLAITPVKFGISFTAAHLNQAGALVLLYTDGSAQVNHGGVELGQGIHTNIRAVAAKELGLSPARVRVMPTSTDKVPNTSPTAASSGTDLNGAAVKNACEILRVRLSPVAAKLLSAKIGHDLLPVAVSFADDAAFVIEKPDMRVPFAEVARRAWLDRISLGAAGYYRTPDIHFDWSTGRGRPFHYFAVGAAVSEVEVDGFTGMMQVLRTDILHDAGDSINAGVNRGQIEGGFVQGMGWLTCEELKWDAEGRLLTHSPDTYKIPAAGDAPREFNVKFLTAATQPGVIHGSKAVGEPPLMLAISVREAIRDALAAFGAPGAEIALPSPATSEAIFLAVQRERARAARLAAEAEAARPRRRRPVTVA